MDSERVTGSGNTSFAPGEPGRGYTRAVFAVVLGVGLLDLFLWGLGFLELGAFRHWWVALVLGILGALAWEVVLKFQAPGGTRLAAWIAFPLAWLLAIAMIPFLVLSVWPRLEGWFFRAQATFEEDTGRITIDFPLDMEPGGVNLRLGSTAVPQAFEVEKANAFRWQSPRRLELDAREIFKEMQIHRPPSTVGLNTIPDARRLRYASGDELPEQTIPLKAPGR